MSPRPLARAESPGVSALSEPTGECLLEDELLELEAGRCSEAWLERLDAHLDGCASCRELVHHLLGRQASCAVDESADGDAWLTTFMPGHLVASRYLIRRFVGKGGMGEVYEAFDQLMSMRVALKTVICTASDRPNAVRKLMDEVKNALRVGHPNVCRINELQEHHDPLDPSATLPFFTMEFVDGERLGNRSKHGPLPLGDARAIAGQLLEGLAAAHARGVLHLDLKSDNVMLRHGFSPPEVVIMDFGLSRALDRPARQPGDDHPFSDELDELVGTLPYMSVEQLESQPELGPASDVYSFGVVLYEMLTGRLPFLAQSSDAMLLEQRETRPAPPSRYVPSLRPELDRFVLRCLHSDARERFASAGAALEALDLIGEWQRGPEPLVRRWHWLACAAAGGLAIAALLDALALREPKPVQTQRSHATEPPATGTPARSSEPQTVAHAEALADSTRRRFAAAAPAAGALDVSGEATPAALDAPSGRDSAGATASAPVPERRRGEGSRRDALATDARGDARATPLDAAEERTIPSRSATGPRATASFPPLSAGGAPARAQSARRAGTTASNDPENWTPRALPRSLLVPARSATNSH